MLVPGSVNPLLLTSAAGAAAGGISRSLRCNSADSAYLSRTPGSAGNRRTWTWAGWVKRSNNSGYQALFSANNGNSTAFDIAFNGDNFGAYLGIGPNLVAAAVYRDFSAWYHILCAADTTQATASNRIKLYINGEQITAFGASNYPSQNFDYDINNTTAHAIGRIGGSSSGYFSGYLADVYLVDGQQLTPSSFTETDATTGQLIPLAYTGSYGTNGFHLEFSDNSGTTSTTLGKDSAGSNNWTPNNFSVSSGAGNDSLVDVPTNGAQTDTGVGGEVRGNYCTLNPLKASSTLGNGNLEITSASGGQNTFATFAVSSGKWYWECSGSSFMTGINLASASLTDLTTNRAYNSDGEKYSGSSNSGYGSSFTSGDTIGVALDLDNGNLVFYKNGVSQGTAFSSLSGTYSPWLRVGSATTPIFNFGQRPFAYTAPSGFKALCTANLPAPLVTKPSTVMDVKLYTGNGSTQTISGLGFSPDLVWIKSRSFAESHRILDTIRTATKTLYSDLTIAEGTDSTGLTAFNSDGFTLGSSTAYNQSSSTFVAWTWDAGSSTDTNNTAGSITSSVRANATAGFSIVTYTGTGANATVGHGLGVAPRMVVIKRRDTTGNWAVYHAELANTQYMLLNSNAAVATGTTYWNSTAPTSTVFSVGTSTDTNASSGTYVAYCFSAVSGYSAFGGYQAGTEPFVFLGFRPRYVMIKRTASGDGWAIFDTSRTTYNVATSRLEADTSAAEGGTDGVDLLSNGFKIKTTWGGMGGSSGSGLMIYAAFAEAPFNFSRAR